MTQGNKQNKVKQNGRKENNNMSSKWNIPMADRVPPCWCPKSCNIL